jgi:hypothetical protein
MFEVAAIPIGLMSCCGNVVIDRDGLLLFDFAEDLRVRVLGNFEY